MRMIAAVVMVVLGIVSQVLGAGDPASTVVKTDKEEKTTFQRDGKTILIVTVYKSSNPARRLLRQQVIFDGNVIAELTEYLDKRGFRMNPKSPVAVGLQQTISTGAIDGVIVENSEGIIEIFEVKDSRLVPVSGKKLESYQDMKKDMTGLLQSAKDSTPEEFRKRVKEVVKKRQPKEKESDGHELQP
jgi:hypothetical protein